jgi:hypothetical protein
MKILAFAPNSAIWPHAFPEALILESLQKSGHQICYVGCGQLFEKYCISMSAYGIKPDALLQDKQKVCKLCANYKNIIKNDFSFNGFDLVDDVKSADREQVAAILQNATPSNFWDIELDGIPVGRYSLHEFLLKHKKSSLQFSDEEWKQYIPQLENTLLSFFASKRMLDREMPDRVLVYNSFYSVNHVCCELAAQRGIPHYLLHAGGNMHKRMQTISITRGYAIHELNKNPLWKKYREIPCSREILSSVTDHILSLLNAKSGFVYSAPKSREELNLRNFFGVTENKKILLATMSSRDERFALETIGTMPQVLDTIYPTQIEWIKALLNYVRTRDDLFLIIRVHPRDFPNKREKVKSSQAFILESLFQNIPDNVRINWPSDNISLYDLAEIVDVVLNAWSNVGKEMTLLGIPVVAYSADTLCAYPSDINYVGATQEEYFHQIEQALSDGWSLENVRKAYRWCGFEYSRLLLNISESFKYDEDMSISLIDRVLKKLYTIYDPYHQQKSDCKNRAERLDSQAIINQLIVNANVTILDNRDSDTENTVSLSEETMFLREELRRVAIALYGNNLDVVRGKLGQNIIRCIN